MLGSGDWPIGGGDFQSSVDKSEVLLLEEQELLSAFLNGFGATHPLPSYRGRIANLILGSQTTGIIVFHRKCARDAGRDLSQ